MIRFNCERELNHAVQIVGYDTTGSVPYYIVRNSWGTEFGLNGYLHVAVGGDLCGRWRHSRRLGIGSAAGGVLYLRLPLAMLVAVGFVRAFNVLSNDGALFMAAK